MLLAPLAICGCSQERAPGAGESSHRDSAGVEIVVTGPLLDSTAARLLVDATSTPSVHEVGVVTGVAILADRRIVVADASRSRLAWLDSSGALLQLVGRRGEGPGELDRLGKVYRCSGDTIVTHSHGARLSWFDSRGAFVQMRNILPLRRGSEGLARNCSAVLTVRPVQPRRTDSLIIFWQSLVDTSMVDVTTLAQAPRGSATIQGRRLPVPIPFGVAPVFTSNGDRVFVGSGATAEVREYDRRGRLVRIVRWSATASRVTDADRQHYEATREQIRVLHGRAESEDFAPITDFTLPARKPIYSRLFLDDDGFLWVQRYPQTWPTFARAFADLVDEDSDWWLFSPTGTLVTRVTIPAGLELRAVRGDAAVVLDTREQRLYRVHHNTPENHGRQDAETDRGRANRPGL